MDESVEATRTRVLNESSGLPRLQMRSPDMAAYIQAPGAGNYLPSAFNSFVSGFQQTHLIQNRTVAENIPLCLKQW